MEQGTQEWLDMRKNHIMASDSPIILGVSPWRTQNDLWRDKLGIGEPQEETYAMRRGKEQEPISRRAYEDYTGISVRPDIVFHQVVKYMGASLDGISYEHKRLVELKNPGEKDHQIAREGKVPKKYIPQIQHQLACTQQFGIESADYFSFHNGEKVVVQVERDDIYLDYLYKAVQKFWDMVLNFDEPDLVEKDYNDMRHCSECRNIYQRIQSRNLKELSKADKEDRQMLKDRCGGRSAIGDGFKFTRYTRPGNVNYKKIPELKGIDLDVYRNKPIEVWRLS